MNHEQVITVLQDCVKLVNKLKDVDLFDEESCLREIEGTVLPKYNKALYEIVKEILE